MKGRHPDIGAEVQDPKPSSSDSLPSDICAPRPLGQPRPQAEILLAGADDSTMTLADPVVVAAPGGDALLLVAKLLHNDNAVTTKL